jgi:hypothetical protein
LTEIAKWPSARRQRAVTRGEVGAVEDEQVALRVGQQHAGLVESDRLVDDDAGHAGPAHRDDGAGGRIEPVEPVHVGRGVEGLADGEDLLDRGQFEERVPARGPVPVDDAPEPAEIDAGLHRDDVVEVRRRHPLGPIGGHEGDRAEQPVAHDRVPPLAEGAVIGVAGRAEDQALHHQAAVPPVGEFAPHGVVEHDAGPGTGHRNAPEGVEAQARAARDGADLVEGIEAGGGQPQLALDLGPRPTGNHQPQRGGEQPPGEGGAGRHSAPEAGMGHD